MYMKAAPHYLIVRVEKKDQKERANKIGSIFIPETHKDMRFNQEWGEVVSIGEKAHKNFPEITIGDTIIIHHFVQGQSKEDSREYHLLHEDDNSLYYSVTTEVTTSDSVSRANETYGILRDGDIIPSPSFIFLKKPEKEIPRNESIEKVGELYQFTNWNETREEVEDRMKKVKRQNELIKSDKDAEMRAFQARNEEELQIMSDSINKRTFEPYEVVSAPEIVSRWFGVPIKKGQIIFMQSNAYEEVTVKGVAYFVAETKYIGFIVN